MAYTLMPSPDGSQPDGLAVGVAVLHTGAMLVAGGTVVIAVHRWLRLKFLSKGWFDLDLLWAASLVLVSAVGVYAAW